MVDDARGVPRWRALLLREWLPALSLAGLIVSSLYAGRLPSVSTAELQVLLLLFALFVAVRGIELSGVFAHVAGRMEGGRHNGVKLVLTTFFLSMLVTNDVALIVVVPLTLALPLARREILVALEAVAANAGSALTPFGNPQNLFIYWYYGVPPGRFMLVMAPLALVFMFVLTALAARLGGGAAVSVPARVPAPIAPSVYGAVSMLAVAVLVVLRLLPPAVAALVIAYALVLDRPSLRVDYGLLLTFLLFFGIAENMKEIVASGTLDGGAHVFAAAALTSQVISNVPAALLFAKLTDRWPALLWGVNVGGFGSLIGSLANLIAYRLVLNRRAGRGAARFTAKFIAINYAAFALGVAVYAAVKGYVGG